MTSQSLEMRQEKTYFTIKFLHYCAFMMSCIRCGCDKDKQDGTGPQFKVSIQSNTN